MKRLMSLGRDKCLKWAQMDAFKMYQTSTKSISADDLRHGQSWRVLFSAKHPLSRNHEQGISLQRSRIFFKTCLEYACTGQKSNKQRRFCDHQCSPARISREIARKGNRQSYFVSLQFCWSCLRENRITVQTATNGMTGGLTD